MADEVRNLAQRSDHAAGETAALIEDSIAKTHGGETRLDNLAVVIRGMAGQIVPVKALIDEGKAWL